MSRTFYLVILLCLARSALSATSCGRYPANTSSGKSPVDENFIVLISGNPDTYILGQEYTVSLRSFNNRHFVGFSLFLESTSNTNGYDPDVGQFRVNDDDIDTRYSPNCINMVESTNMIPKTSVNVTWIAPSSPTTGCILIRATVLQHREVWFMDDGGLTRQICEEVNDEIESLRSAEEEQTCCACDEARYELIFEGKWSRNLHPKDFPAKGWITRFGDIVGASHVADYRFFRSAEKASPAMKEYGEHGLTTLLEREFYGNFKNKNIRTIVKSRGLAYPNLQGQSIASARVDPVHHFLSLASKIEPSPDWIVGISGLELCMPNCTWVESKEINLYPWDLGTDAGPSYTSPDQPEIPQNVIRRINSTYPSDIRSPFFDETGEAMKAMAKLTVRRQRVYERLCEDEESNNIDIPHECYTHPWSGWSECSATCGKGRRYRTRVYKQNEVAEIYGCNIKRHQSKKCYGKKCKENELILGAEDEEEEAEQEEEEPINRYQQYPGAGSYDNRENRGSYDSGESLTKASCQLTNWGSWSKCSKICGEGQEMRTREYINPTAEKWCQNAQNVKLTHYRKCVGQDCLGDVRNTNRRQNFGRDENIEDEQQPHISDETETNDFVGEKGNKFKYNQPNKNNELGTDDKQDDNKSTNYENYGKTAYEERQENVNARNSYDNRNSYGNRNSYEDRNSYNNRYSNNNRNSYNNRNSDDDRNSDNDRNSDDNKNSYDNTQTHSPVEEEDANTESPITECCFQKLQIYPCLNTTIIANYWFYNYCTDQCMLFGADKCDRNINKFTTLEACEERCRTAIDETYLRQRQQDCYANRFEKRPRKKGRRYP